jgi:hypothetical protein
VHPSHHPGQAIDQGLHIGHGIAIVATPEGTG